MTWVPADFLIATSTGPSRVLGYVYRGVGLSTEMKASPKGRRPPRWVLTHLGSGHKICAISGDGKTVFPIAAEIAEATEWDFDSLRGWVDRDPEAPQKLWTIASAHKEIILNSRYGESSERVACQIATERAS